MQREWSRRLADAVAATLTDRGAGADLPTTFVVTGPPGIGKSTGVSQLINGWFDDGVVVRQARAHEMSARTPLGVLGDALGRPVGHPPAADTLDHLTAALDDLCAAGPLVLVIDDAHQADSDSLSVLLRWSAIARDLPLALVLARRPAPAREVLTLLIHQPWVATVEVPSLDSAEARQIAGEALGAPVDGSWDATLEAAAGNPFHLRELLARSRPGGTATAAAPAAGLEVTIAGQLAFLTREARTLVDQLAVWGDPVSPREIAALSGVPLMGIAAAVTEAVDAGVLVWRTDEVLDFRHDLYRDVAYRALAPATRRLMHGACADHLAGRPAAAHHLERSGATTTEPVLAERLRRVADELPGSPGVAADLLASAAALAPAGPLAGRIAVERALALVKAGRMAAAAEVAGEALRASPPPEVAGALARILVLTHSSRARVAAVDAVVGRVLSGPPVPAGVRARLASVRSWVHVLAGDLGPPPDPADLAAATTVVVDPATGSLPLATTAVRVMLAGHGPTAVRLAETAAEVHHELAGRDTGETSSVDIWPALFRLFTYGPIDADRWARHWRDRTAALADGWVDPFHQYVSAAIALAGGRLDDAAAELDAGLESAAESSSGWSSWAVGNRADLDLLRGHTDAAAGRLAAFRSLDLPETLGIPVVDLMAAEIAHQHGDPDEAARLAHDSWARAADRGVRLWTVLSAPAYLRLARELGTAGLAERIVTDAGDARSTLMPALAPAVTLLDAMAGADPAAAARAAAGFAATGDRLGAARALAEAALLAAESAELDEARRHATAAVSAFTEMGATGAQRSLAARLRFRGLALGAVGRRGRPTHGWESLTPTERQVAELVADGRSGPDIARSLYVSPRTVQTHVSHALQKLGVSSRLELAARVLARRGGISVD